MTGPGRDAQDQIELAQAYVELQNLLIEGPQVSDFLQQMTVLAAAVVGAAGCGITLQRDGEVATVAGSNQLANYVDEIQYGHGQGPCLQAMLTANTVTVTDLATEARWPAYTARALDAGVGSSLSLPLVLDSKPIGALNLYLTEPAEFTAAQVDNAWSFARQAVSTMTIAYRQAQQVDLTAQLRQALASRAIIDQAIGIIMGQRRCDSTGAFAVLRETSQKLNHKLRDVAAGIIKTATGKEPVMPRPFTEPRPNRSTP